MGMNSLPKTVSSTRLQLWRKRGRHQEAATGQKRRPVEESVMSPCEVCAKPVELGENENSCKNADNCGSLSTVFVSLFELIEASHRVHTAPRRSTATPFSMRQQKLGGG